MEGALIADLLGPRQSLLCGDPFRAYFRNGASRTLTP